ncbi:Predicted PurR-regulated permease PerM [Lutibacter oricola]|uniref:Predicted PurR-regulated permease PerM n=1 Tax=Lutibacter oricola TaxID=762486 RepID=A0A1H3A519_9FLAO|nr:AI-2E family transporter [Lutibacter oricola]SDX24695.1 Predicted PurR-regulated permease PerM [Lutibacter oricola]
MTSNTITNGILKAIGMLIGIALLLFFLYQIQSILVYVAIAAVIALIASPILKFFRKKLKMPNSMAVLVTMTLFLGVFFGLISMFIPLIIKQGENLSLLNIEKLQSTIEHLLVQINDYFLAHNIDVLNELKNADLFKNAKAIPNLLNSVIGTLGNLSIGLFSVIFITFFLMKDTHIMEKSVYVLVSDKSESKLKNSLGTINNLLSRYFIGLVFQISILFIIYAIVLASFGIENSIVIAFLCALLNLIPYIGPLIGGVLMLFLSMSSNLGLDFQTEILPTTIYVMIGYIFAQLIDNFISQPLIFSKSVKSHPLEIFLIILISGTIFGVVGMVVAIPTYTAIKVILKAFLADNKIVKSLTKDL